MEVLFDADQIAARIGELAAEITDFYRDKEFTAVSLLNGSLFFTADLLRRIELPMWVDTLGVASYVQRQSSGSCEFRSKPKLPVSGRHILLIDDILDSGRTLGAVREYMLAKGAISVCCCVLLDKRTTRAAGAMAHAEWSAFEIDDVYVAGYGLDADEYLRNIPAVVLP